MPKNRDPSPVLPLAPRDPLVREIQAVLKMVRPHRDGPDDADDPNRAAEYDGYCGAACEAYLHLYEESRSDLTVKRQTFTNWRGRRTGSHWWLEGPKGVIDLTLGPRDHRSIASGQRKMDRYEGSGGTFQANPGPSKRAAALIHLVRARRAGTLG